MFGQNKIEKPQITDGKILQINEIFDTFQGEALYSGFPATFIRLAKCNLQCQFCDTEFEKYKELKIADIISKINHKLVIITGGEPLRQNITPLCQELIAKNHLIQIETNGTLFLDLPKEVQICCSPKISNGKYHQIRPDLLPKITFFKFLISKFQNGYDKIPDLGQKKYNIPIYLQPIDEYNEEKNQKNKEFTLKLAKENNCRLS
ncbi:7-carboxy-7-deazaguanine synthase QueE, partial [Rickettsiales bacterium]|nr:7-carboxy-7-deazaguanine synthase QueE [Rickettsiales bacterium]